MKIKKRKFAENVLKNTNIFVFYLMIFLDDILQLFFWGSISTELWVFSAGYLYGIRCYKCINSFIQVKSIVYINSPKSKILLIYKYFLIVNSKLNINKIQINTNYWGMIEAERTDELMQI